MVSESHADGPDEGLVTKATRAELGALGALQTVEAAVALNLASILDDRAGIQAGGVASTAKQLLTVMDGLREKHKPKEKGRLELLRGGASSTG
jgi:hypothetical protein